MNPTPDTVILKRNLSVASIQPIDNIMEGSFHRPQKKTTVKTKVPEHLLSLMENVSEKLTPNQKSEIANIIGKYCEIFEGLDGKLGPTDKVEHCISTENARPIKIPPRRLPISQRYIVRKEIDKMLKDGIIEPCISSWSAPIVLVKNVTIRRDFV